MIRVLIVDDEPLPCERIRDLLGVHPTVEVLGVRHDGASAIEAVRTLEPDLLFLDIRMPDMDGFEVIEALGPERTPAVVFVTAFDEFALKAFDVHAVDYLLKPIDARRFHTAVQRALVEGPCRAAARSSLGGLVGRVHRDRGPAERLVLRTGARVHVVPMDAIDRFEAAQNYVRVFASGEEHLARVTLRSLTARLDGARFVQVHRSVIVALHAIRRVDPTDHGEYRVTLRDASCIKVSRSYAAALRARLAALPGTDRTR